MDYSLLLVIEWAQVRGSLTENRNLISNTTTYPDGRVFRLNLHVGVIDYLQEWNFDKKVERLLKQALGNIQGKKANDISAIPPKAYKMRFDNFIRKQILNPVLKDHIDKEAFIK